MGHRWLSQMLYAQRSRHGIWKYRRAIPQALRLAAGRREINVTLSTRDDLEAQLGLMEEEDAPRITPLEQRRMRKTELFDKFLHFGNHSNHKVYH